MADIVAVADIGDLQALHSAELFLECEIVSERLAGMEFIGERVDHGDVDAGRHFFQNTLFVNAGDDALHPTLEVAGHVGDGFALAQPRLGVIEENDVTTHALDADLKRDARAQGGLLKDESNVLAAQHGGEARRARLDVRGALQQLARVRRRPFGAGEEVLGDGYGNRQ